MVHVEIKKNPAYDQPASDLDRLIPGDKYVAYIDVHGVPEWFGDNDPHKLKELVLRHYPQAEIAQRPL